jgi:hypothetical protein
LESKVTPGWPSPESLAHPTTQAQFNTAQRPPLVPRDRNVTRIMQNESVDSVEHGKKASSTVAPLSVSVECPASDCEAGPVALVGAVSGARPGGLGYR